MHHQEGSNAATLDGDVKVQGRNGISPNLMSLKKLTQTVTKPTGIPATRVYCRLKGAKSAREQTAKFKNVAKWGMNISMIWSRILLHPLAELDAESPLLKGTRSLIVSIAQMDDSMARVIKARDHDPEDGSQQYLAGTVASLTWHRMDCPDPFLSPYLLLGVQVTRANGKLRLEQ